jgi:hypothetical protein
MPDSLNPKGLSTTAVGTLQDDIGRAAAIWHFRDVNPRPEIGLCRGVIFEAVGLSMNTENRSLRHSGGVYIRISPGNAPGSPVQQLRLVRTCAKRYGIKIVKRFSDGNENPTPRG